VLLRFVRRYPVALGYLALLWVVTVITQYGLSSDQQVAFVEWSSTNLTNLPHNPIGTMIVSAFISDDTVILWLVVGSAALFPLTRRFGNLRTLVLVAGAHTIGTLVSQGILAWRIYQGALPNWAGAMTEPDVGPSYVIAAGLTAVIVFGPSLLSRIFALVCWLALAPDLFENLFGLDVPPVGHTVSMLSAIVIGGLYALHDRRRAPVPGKALLSGLETQPPLAPPSRPGGRGA
jgi:hypothetical protein